jgi:choline dehydrogenase-like flavoprotein
MAQQFDFVVVGGGSAGAVIASRLSEDPKCRVALIEAGERPPEISALPIAPPVMQLNPATDWMFTADPGKAGLGLNGRRADFSHFSYQKKGERSDLWILVSDTEVPS